MGYIPAIFVAVPSMVSAVLIYIVLQRVGELIYANRNTQRLLSEGGREYGQDHYIFFIILHSAWLIAMIIYVDPQHTISPILLMLFVGTQILRFWVLASIGRWWTTRIISAPHFDRVKKGPYRFIPHPNYMVVVMEIALIPAMLGLTGLAVTFSILNALLLRHRIGVENQVLHQRG